MKTSRLTRGALIAALYVIFTLVSSLLGLASGPIQLRLSEALNVLCLFSPVAIGGLTVGCCLANLLTGCLLWDVALGSLATFLGAWGVWTLRKHPLPALLIPVLTNTLIVPPVLLWVYQTPGTLWFFALTVGLGELLSCTCLGLLLKKPLERIKSYL